MSTDAVAARLALHARTAATGCSSLTTKATTLHVLRHTAAMRLLTAGIDTTVIALWLGHESIETTQIYLHADMKTKETALARTLDSHDSYAASDDDPERLVPNPAKRVAHHEVQAARARYDRAQARTDAAMLAARSPAPGAETILTNPVHDAITADLRAADADLSAAQADHKAIPTRVPLGELHPGQQVLDVETKLITHAIGAAAFNTINALARDIRINTGYARANDEAHALARQALTHSGDIDPSGGVLTVRLDPMPTARATAAIRELCEHLTATNTRYPGTDLTLRYEIKNRP